MPRGVVVAGASPYLRDNLLVALVCAPFLLLSVGFIMLMTYLFLTSDYPSNPSDAEWREWTERTGKKVADVVSRHDQSVSTDPCIRVPTVIVWSEGLPWEERSYAPMLTVRSYPPGWDTQDMRDAGVLAASPEDVKSVVGLSTEQDVSIPDPSLVWKPSNWAVCKVQRTLAAHVVDLQAEQVTASSSWSYAYIIRPRGMTYIEKAEIGDACTKMEDWLESLARR